MIDAVPEAFDYRLNTTPAHLVKRAEFTISCNFVGRGGEHIFLCFCKAWWDDYFNAINVDRKIIKQNDNTCRLQLHIQCILKIKYGEKEFNSIISKFIRKGLMTEN